MKIENYLTYIDNAEDLPFLKTKLFDVNMRLFKSSSEYKEVILTCCKHIEFLARTTFEGYKKPHGMSGANAGIPFNIISIVRNRGKINEYLETMINPKITWSSAPRFTTEVESNCGSIRLKKPIKVKRANTIWLNYYDKNGDYIQGYRYREDCGFTIAHEVDHNLGILITDKQ